MITRAYGVGRLGTHVVGVDATRDEVWIDFVVRLHFTDNLQTSQTQGRLGIPQAKELHAKLGRAIAGAQALHERRVARGEER